MTITFGGDYCLDFELESHAITDLWLAKMRERHHWPLDDPTRFYGFDPIDTAGVDAERRLRACIDTINSYQAIIERPWSSIYDQDLLNYLHNIFERYHGLLDRQTDPWWSLAPATVQQALANLNILVHRAESVARGDQPRFVCTWFGMPKKDQLAPDLMRSLGTLHYEFGGVYLNYVEIGKTLEDLSIDDDQYIGTDAFQPFRHYSADFNVRLYDQPVDMARAKDYFLQHQDFFLQHGIASADDYRVMPWRYRVAKLVTQTPRNHILTAIRSRQQITDIYLP